VAVSKKLPRDTVDAIGRILFTVAMLVTVLLGSRSGLVALLSADWCGGTPVDPVVYTLIALLAVNLAFWRGKPGIWPTVRLGLTMIPGLFLAALAAQITTGCTFVSEWAEFTRMVVEALVFSAVLIPLAELHKHFIESKFGKPQSGA